MTRRQCGFAGLAVGLVMSCVAYAAQAVVTQKDKTFAPDELTQAAGDTLHINNDDDVPHNVLVTGPDGSTENRGVQKPGDSVDVLLATHGDYVIRCGIHPKMKLAVHVN